MPRAGSVSVEVVPDATNFHRTLKEEVLRDADAIGVEAGEKIKAGIDERLHDIHVGARVEDEEAKAEIERLKLQVDELSHKRANIDVRVNNASGVRSWMTSLIAGAVAIAPAFVVAAGGIAGFAALAVPALRDVVKYEHDVGTNAAKAAQDWQNMTAGQRAAADGLTNLRTEFHGLALEVQPQVLQTFNAALFQMERFLPQLVPLAKAGAAALSILINDIGDAVNGPAGQQFFAFITKNLASDMTAIGSTVESLLKAFFSLTEALHPLSLSLLAVVRDGAGFLNWLAQTNPLLLEIAVSAVALYKPLKVLEGLKVASTFSNLSKALTGVKAASGGGGAQFGWIAAMASGLRRVSAESIHAAEVQKLIQAETAASGAGLRVFSVGATGAAEELAVLSRGEKAAAVSMGLLSAIPVAGWALAAGAAIGVLAQATSKPLVSLESLTTQFTKQFNAIGPNVGALKQLTAGYTATQHAVSGLEGPFASFFGQQVGAQSQAKIRNLAVNLDEMAQAFGLTRGQAERVAASLPGVVTGFQQGGSAAAAARQKFAAWALAGAHGVSVMSRLQVEASIMSNSMSTAAQKAQALESAFKSLVSPTLDLADAAVAAKQSQVSLAQALKASHDRLGTATQAQRDATSATTDAVRKTEAFSQTLLANGASASRAAGPMQALANQLERAGVKGGIAARLIAELRAQIAALHSKEILIRVEEQIVGGGGAIRAGTGGQAGIRSYAGGGIIPGYSPGRDTVGPLWASPGEGFAVPELVQAIGPDRFMELNRIYSGGRNPAPRHFAAGGIAGPGTGGGTSLSHRSRSLGDEFDIFLNVLAQAPDYKVSKTGVADSERLAKEFRAAVTKSTAEIRDMGRSALTDLKDYYTGPHSRELQNALNRQVGALEHLSTRSQRIAEEIKAERQYAQQETQALKQFSGISSITGATDPTTGETAPVTGKDIKSGLAKDLAQLRKFESVIKRLKRAKVVRVLIEQVIALGPVDGVTYGEAILSGGAALIRELNKEEREISREEKKIGQTAAEIHYGQSISKGFLSGLEKEKHKLDREMHRLGDEIARELLDALHGKLPKHGGGGHHKAHAHAALSNAALSSAVSVGGTTVIAHPLSRSDVAAMRSTLHRISEHQLHQISRQQGQRIITLLENINSTAPKRTGAAVGDAINGGASRAVAKGRASTR